MDPSAPHRRLVMVADMERYSKRKSSWQREAQATFLRALDEAAGAAGLTRRRWRRQPSGDGELAVLPANVPEHLVLGGFLPALDNVLRPRNARLQPDAKVRVRVAIHHGPVYLNSANGFAGTAVNITARLADAPLLKRALAMRPRASVAAVVSDDYYRQVVSEADYGLRPELFRKIRVTLADKEFDEPAWIQVIGEDITQLDLTPEGNRADDATAAPVDRPQPAGGISIGTLNASRSPTAIGPHAVAIGKISRRQDPS